MSLYTISGKGRGAAGFSTTKHRQGAPANVDEIKQGHSRVFSETSVPSSLQTAQIHGQPTESTGPPNAEPANQDRHSEPSRNWFWNGLTRNTSLSHANRHANGLQALTEDGPALDSFDQRISREDTIEEEQSVDLQSPTVTAFNAKHPPLNGLTRTRSAAQMHDLREQMQDLKGKISTLKKRALEDNLRRRSLQSLRTPSPFTDAEHFYTGALQSEVNGATSKSEAHRAIDPDHATNEHSRSPPQDSGHASPILQANGHEDRGKAVSEEYSEEQLPPLEQDFGEELSIKTSNSFPSPKKRLILVDESTELPDEINSDALDPEEVQQSEAIEAKEDSLYGDQEYHETSATPIIERHEDRPDAFDYEHFILHSAMGSYSGVGVRRSSSRRKRSNSQSSESSVETTKPRNSMENAPHGQERLSIGAHARQGSIDTVSSANTFATADEGQTSDEEVDDLTPRKSVEESWHPEAYMRHQNHGSGESAPETGQPNGYGPKFRTKKHIATAQKDYANGIASRSPPIDSGPPPPPPDLLTVLSATTSWQEGAPPRKISLGDRDKELVERLVKSLAKVCTQVRALESEDSKYEARVVRRKLDAARRVLDGEMNGEVF